MNWIKRFWHINVLQNMLCTLSSALRRRWRRRASVRTCRRGPVISPSCVPHSRATKRETKEPSSRLGRNLSWAVCQFWTATGIVEAIRPRKKTEISDLGSPKETIANLEYKTLKLRTQDQRLMSTVWAAFLLSHTELASQDIFEVLSMIETRGEFERVMF